MRLQTQSERVLSTHHKAQPQPPKGQDAAPVFGKHRPCHDPFPFSGTCIGRAIWQAARLEDLWKTSLSIQELSALGQ